MKDTKPGNVRLPLSPFHQQCPIMQSVLRPSRSLRKHAALLARDAIAVLTGLRPAAMLDYAVLDGGTLQAIGAAVRAAAPAAGAGGRHPTFNAPRSCD